MLKISRYRVLFTVRAKGSDCVSRGGVWHVETVLPLALLVGSHELYNDNVRAYGSNLIVAAQNVAFYELDRLGSVFGRGVFDHTFVGPRGTGLLCVLCRAATWARATMIRRRSRTTFWRMVTGSGMVETGLGMCSSGPQPTYGRCCHLYSTSKW
jgi:hypothetical protein